MTDAAAPPIEVFYWSTPNGRKVTILLEELAVPYRVNFIDINNMEQWTAEYEAISPNHQIPAIRDPAGPDGQPIAIAESAAILMYLGRKFGRFYPQDERQRVAVEQWLMWQISSFGPFLGQGHHFNWAASEEVPYAINRYHQIAERLYETLERRLQHGEFIAGDYSIADIAIYCWVDRHARHRIDLDDYPSVKAWFTALGERPAVQRGMAVIKPGVVDTGVPTPAWEKAKG
ncbi:MAG: glutathione S-transferase N-terminal domain-containing protein [Bauldia sp.]|nr:glutathione S-transferase N-terminal domain-containing protein [Bauldia sp.]